MEKGQLLHRKLTKSLEQYHQLLAVAVGSGMIARYSLDGGADFLLCLSSGLFRQMGWGSLAAFLPASNSNDVTMQLGCHQILPAIGLEVPVIFGLHATDPTINLPEYIKKIKSCGFTGIINYPTIGLYDGTFRSILEENGYSYSKEVEAIHLASQAGLFTVAFVFDEAQALQMIENGANIICAHLGLTKGGKLGAKKVMTVEEGIEQVNAIFHICDTPKFQSKNIIKMVFGGPFNSKNNISYLFARTNTQGFICGSNLERISLETHISETVNTFKSIRTDMENKSNKLVEKTTKRFDYVGFVENYVAENYMHPIVFNDVVKMAYCSRNHLSYLIKRDLGCTFTEYLTKYRIGRSIALLEKEDYLLTDISRMVGFRNYATFSKCFHNIHGVSPKQYCEFTQKARKVFSAALK